MIELWLLNADRGLDAELAKYFREMHTYKKNTIAVPKNIWLKSLC